MCGPNLGSTWCKGTAPLILNAMLDGDEWLTSLPGQLTGGKQPEYPLNGRLGGPQSQSKHFGDDKILLPLMEFEPRSVQPVL